MKQPGSTSPGFNAHEAKRLAAAVRLIGDDSPIAFRAARELLLAAGERGRAAIDTGIATGDAATRMRLRAVLRALDVRQHLTAFTRLTLDRGGRALPESLLAGAVLASHLVRTFVPDAAELQRFLRGEAEVLRARFAGRSLGTCARMIADHLAGKLGFQGGSVGTVDLDRVLLDRVIEKRVGIPVSVSLVYLLVARWAGLSVAGVAMPDHFLVRLHGIRPVLVDPFHGGRSVTKVDCIRYLRSLGHEQVRGQLRDLSDRELLAHYLRELRRAAGGRGQPEVHRSLDDALQHLDQG